MSTTSSLLPPAAITAVDIDSPLQQIIASDARYLADMDARWRHLMRGASRRRTGELGAELNAMIDHLIRTRACLDRAGAIIMDREAMAARGALRGRRVG